MNDHEHWPTYLPLSDDVWFGNSTVEKVITDFVDLADVVDDPHDEPTQMQRTLITLNRAKLLDANIAHRAPDSRFYNQEPVIRLTEVLATASAIMRCWHAEGCTSPAADEVIDLVLACEDQALSPRSGGPEVLGQWIDSNWQLFTDGLDEAFERLRDYLTATEIQMLDHPLIKQITKLARRNPGFLDDLARWMADTREFRFQLIPVGIGNTYAVYKHPVEDDPYDSDDTPPAIDPQTMEKYIAIAERGEDAHPDPGGDADEATEAIFTLAIKSIMEALDSTGYPRPKAIIEQVRNRYGIPGLYALLQTWITAWCTGVDILHEGRHGMHEYTRLAAKMMIPPRLGGDTGNNYIRNLLIAFQGDDSKDAALRLIVERIWPLDEATEAAMAILYMIKRLWADLDDAGKLDAFKATLL